MFVPSKRQGPNVRNGFVNCSLWVSHFINISIQSKLDIYILLNKQTVSLLTLTISMVLDPYVSVASYTGDLYHFLKLFVCSLSVHNTYTCTCRAHNLYLGHIALHYPNFSSSTPTGRGVEFANKLPSYFHGCSASYFVPHCIWLGLPYEHEWEERQLTRGCHWGLWFPTF